ncbi:MAG: DUF885 domain-containing protein [Gammaproteobacteria bacterium]|nr:DUF885 domain-containing protein [Gammaproteobacteria bacterium]
MSIRLLFPALVLLLTAACSKAPEESPAERVNAIASEFVHEYFTQFPEEVYEVGYGGAPMDRFGDHSEAAIAAWDARVDAWLAALNSVDVTTLAGTADAITYVFAREQLQSHVDRRICHTDLWNISPTWTGWQFMFASTFAIQPIETDNEQQDAIDRIVDAARYLRTDVSNLRRGIDQGYLAPHSNVVAVIDQVTSLIDTAAEDSPMFSPAARSTDVAFISAYRDAYESTFKPALVAYRDYLVSEYQGRESIGVGNNPNGDACYAASVRYWSSISISAEDIHRAGLAQMARIQSEMLQIAQTSFGSDDVKGLLAELRTNPEYTFGSEQELLDYINAAVQRGKDAVPQWFGTIPDAELLVIPSPAYEKDSGGGFYSAGAADGSRPATYQVGTYNPQGISKAGPESTAFHESYPGHHLQVSLALTNQSLHPILRYIGVSGFVEGWALYTERLADEMGIYSSAVARLGMLSNEAYRAARLVVDPGMHVKGWSRDDAIQYMLDHTAEGIDSLTSEVDRYAAVPGQATSYLLGSLEIQRLRNKAEDALGDDFDIREFHDRILANGGVTLPMLATEIDAWIAER